MISMTGFGRGVAAAGPRRIVVEIRSVNNRGLDIKVRGRNLAPVAEVEIVRAVRAACGRGSIQVAVEEDGGKMGEAASVEGDELGAAKLAALAVELRSLHARLGLDGGVDLVGLAAFVRLDRERSKGDVATPITWPELAPALADALEGLAGTRRQEGEGLGRELQARAATLGRLVADIKEKVPVGAERLQARLVERIGTTLTALSQASPSTTVEPTRLAQELAILADRLDVSEELARLDVHLDRLTSLLRGDSKPGAAGDGQGIGRPLEFLLQEIGRELNTLGTKAQDADISALGIAAKAELEKIREQAQNIE